MYSEHTGESFYIHDISHTLVRMEIERERERGARESMRNERYGDLVENTSMSTSLRN